MRMEHGEQNPTTTVGLSLKSCMQQKSKDPLKDDFLSFFFRQLIRLACRLDLHPYGFVNGIFLRFYWENEDVSLDK